MSEIRRVLLSRRTGLYLFIAVFLGCVFFMYDCFSEKQITLTGDELTVYIDDYADFLKSVQDNADNFGTITALSGGFSAKNIRKTAEDYNALSGVQPVYGENKGIVLISDYVMADFLIIGVTLLTAISFIEEKRKGLTFLVRSTKNGRRALSVRRVTVIFIIAFITSIAVHTGLFITAQLTCGDMNVMRSIQSIPEFSLCPFKITILDYLLLSVIIKALSAVIAGLLIFLLPCILEPAIAVTVFAFFAVSEYLLYGLILPTDRLSPLKFCNVIALLRTDIFFKEYCNLNIFGNAVSFFTCAVFTGILLMITLAILCIVFCSREKSGLSLGGKFTEKISSALSRKAPSLPLWLWETKKVFINQKGAVILAAVVYIAVNSALSYRYLIPSYTKYELAYYNKYAGVITEEMLNEINTDSYELQSEYDELYEEFLRIYEESGRIFTDEALEIYDKLQILGNRLDALDKLKAQAESGLSYTAETGINTHMIRTAVYELFLLDDRITTNKNALYIMLCIISVFAGINANENHSNMNYALKSSYKGRKKLTAIKLAIIGITSMAVTVGIFLPQFIQIGSEGFNDIDATAQSLEFLRFMPFEISIKGYMIIMMCVRMLSTFLVGIFVMAVSRYCRSSITAMCVCSAVLIVPAVLSGTGIINIISMADFIGFCC